MKPPHQDPAVRHPFRERTLPLADREQLAVVVRSPLALRSIRGSRRVPPAALGSIPDTHRVPREEEEEEEQAEREQEEEREEQEAEEAHVRGRLREVVEEVEGEEAEGDGGVAGEEGVVEK